MFFIKHISKFSMGIVRKIYFYHFNFSTVIFIIIITIFIIIIIIIIILKFVFWLKQLRVEQQQNIEIK